MTQTHPVTIYQQALQQRKFLLQQCRDCGRFLAPPRDTCDYCGDTDFRWVEAGGWGMILSAKGEPLPGTDWEIHRIVLDEGVEIHAPVMKPETSVIRSGCKVLGHVGLLAGEPAVLFACHEDVDEW